MAKVAPARRSLAGRDHIRTLLAEHGKLDNGWLVINGTMSDQQVMPLRDAPERCPYFAIVIVHGHGRRPANDM